MPTMTDRLRTLFAETLNRPMPPFTPSLTFEEIPGWDSVAHLALLLTIERTFSAAFTSKQMVEMRTVGDLLAALGETP